MTETAFVIATCTKCRYEWKPHGYQKFILPHSDVMVCPKCKHKEEMTWADSETEKKQLQKKLGLVNDGELINKITELEKKFSLLQKELEIEIKKREISETELQKVKDWAKDRENDFREIEILAEEERERLANNEDMT